MPKPNKAAIKLTIDLVAELSEELMTLDGLQSCIMGLSIGPGGCGRTVLVYDREKIIQLLINRDEMSREEAIEFYMYNIECLTGMTGGPLFVTRSESIMEGV